MKRTAVILILALVLCLPACGGEKAAPAPAPAAPTAGPVQTPEVSTAPAETEIDVVLSALSTTMVYGELFSMAEEPSRYAGRRVRLAGLYACTEFRGKRYDSCLVLDATGCCYQGLDFELTEGRERLPEPGQPITVTGVFDSYREEVDGNQYLFLVLRDAELA